MLILNSIEEAIEKVIKTKKIVTKPTIQDMTSSLMTS